MIDLRNIRVSAILQPVHAKLGDLIRAQKKREAEQKKKRKRNGRNTLHDPS